MKSLRVVCLVLGLALVLSPNLQAEVDLVVDTAPNVYGSPDWAPWWAAAKDDVVAATFENMRSGMYPGTTTTDPYEEIVYSTGDLGKRLHWIYWMPGETVAGLEERFEVKWSVDWDGIVWTEKNGVWQHDAPEKGWEVPVHWEDYDDGQGTIGVIGSVGFAWWATDDEAEPYDTDGNPYNETDQADIDMLAMRAYQLHTFSHGQARIRADASAPWEYTTILVDVISEFESLACCFPSGECEDYYENLCLVEGGTPQGAGSQCATTECPTQQCFLGAAIAR